MKTPILETDRLLLRPFYMEDAQAVFDCWESDPDVSKYMFWTSHNDIKQTISWDLHILRRYHMNAIEEIIYMRVKSIF